MSIILFFSSQPRNAGNGMELYVECCIDRDALPTAVWPATWNLQDVSVYIRYENPCSASKTCQLDVDLARSLCIVARVFF